MDNNLVITIMAAGEGKRMNSTCPKVLHLFHGKPILYHIIQACLSLHPKKLIIITGKHDVLIRSTLLNYMEITSILFVKQLLPQGTGDAIKACLPYYEHNDKVLIVNGDMPLINKQLLEGFIVHGTHSKMNIMVAKLDNPKGYGRIVYDPENPGTCLGIVEEKDCLEEQRAIQMINTGLYFIDADLLQTYVSMIQNDNAQGEYYLTDIVKLIRSHSTTMIHICEIDDEKTILISGVNTQDELHALEENYRTIL
jgi:bifunctional UDP-N-acetylglucosamine pyrophosphorylase/glucosamine-1-phosphate N-acetyltransferase